MAFAAQPITHAYVGKRKYDPDIKMSLYKGKSESKVPYFIATK